MCEKRQDGAIRVVRARTHNLKGIDCRVPHGRVTVVTGPSGAGKSSLAFDTIFAEAQRRFVESMSTYARQFLNQMERPPVEAIDNVLPAVALEARNSIQNARSTVGTITEIYDVLRLLFTHLGVVHCPRDQAPARRYTPQEAASDAVRGELGETLTLLVHLPRPRREADVALRELIRQGYGRRLEGEEVVRMAPTARWLKRLDPLPLVLGRFRAGSSTTRLVAALEEGFRVGEGTVEVRGDGNSRYYSRHLGCPLCGTLLKTPTPALFSFNSPLGACGTCQGFGRVVGIDRQRVIPDPGRTLAQRPIAPWNTPAYEEHYARLYEACRRRVPLDVPWRDLPAGDREWIWNGDGPFVNLEDFFAWLEHRSYKVHVRVLLARYRGYSECAACGGSRLQPQALAVRLAGETLPTLAALSVEEFLAWLQKRRWNRRQRETAGHLLEELSERVEVLHRVGLDYLTLDRQARTLSGGEAQRIHLAAALGSGLTSTLYVLDEPTVGLHPQDSQKLLALLQDLARRGNTVLVVEHDPTLIRGADHLIDLGPAAGEHGGEVVAEGSLSHVLAVEESVTARHLKPRPRTEARSHQRRRRREQGRDTPERRLERQPHVEIRGARSHNLKDLDVSFPLCALVAVTGVSGSGKSTLVENVLYGRYKRGRGAVDVEPGECRELLGLDRLCEVVLVDQRPLGRSTRSNPVTYIKAYDEIRKLYAATPEARRAGISAGHFSFNLERGRCVGCEGRGVVEVDMQFMAPVMVTCDECQGHRFQSRVLAIRHRGRNIAETLELTVDRALEVFALNRRLVTRLQSLADVGLGYLRLGQSTSTLSGGEAQRLKLASFLGRRDGARLFLFDEPTTGLHLADVEVLYKTLRRLVHEGHTVLVVEHSLELISRADWVVDLGPGGGLHGGELLFSGPLQAFLDEAEGPTVDELRRYLRVRPRAIRRATMVGVDGTS